MEIIKRVVFSIVFIVLLCTLVIEALFFGIRWILTGKEFGKPIVQIFVEHYLN